MRSVHDNHNYGTLCYRIIANRRRITTGLEGSNICKVRRPPKMPKELRVLWRRVYSIIVASQAAVADYMR